MIKQHQNDVPWYRYIDDLIEQRTRVSIGYTNLIATKPYPIDDAALAGFAARYARIKRFQEITRDIFMASLRGDADPEIAASVVGDLPPCRGTAHHLQLTARQLQTPVFFRTDEAAPGTIVEIQCSGSAWCMADQTRQIYQQFARDFGTPKYFPRSLAQGVASSLRNYLGGEPLIHHLLDNASRPHGMRYFIQLLRDEGLRFFSWDPMAPDDCNFVRSHEFCNMRYHGFFHQWLAAAEEGRLKFDLPPTPLYDGKMITAWPFWSKTRAYYPEEIRAILPFSDVVSPEGFQLLDGSHVTIEQYINMTMRQRNYYVKYAGTDPALNWGSRAVYYTGSLSRPACREMFERILQDHRHGHRWIIQEARKWPETVSAVDRSGQEVTVDAYTKLSGFYGPDGLLGIISMQLRSRKVHGTDHTIVSIVH
jgi:hypothetical protein